MANYLLQDHAITLIDSPGFNDLREDENPTKNFAFLADTLLFVLSADAPFRKTERNIVFELMGENPSLGVDFLLNKMDYVEEDEVEEVLEDLSRKVKKHFNQAVIIPFSSEEPEDYLGRLEEFIKTKTNKLLNSDDFFLERSNKVFPWYYQLLNSFNMEREKAILHLQSSVKEIQEQIQLLQTVKREAYRTQVEILGWVNNEFEKKKLRLISELKGKVPKWIKNCSSLVHADSDFKHLHHHLNVEMNREVERLLRFHIMPNFRRDIEEWLDGCVKKVSTIASQKEEIENILSFIIKGARIHLDVYPVNEIIEFQRQHQTEIIKTIQFEQVDIMTKFNVKNALLMGAGRLFGKFNSTNTLLYDQFIRYIETENFEDVVKSYQEMILLHFFDFHSPILKELESICKDVTRTIEGFIMNVSETLDTTKLELYQFLTKPELIDDPIHLLNIQLRRQEILHEVYLKEKVENEEEFLAVT